MYSSTYSWQTQEFATSYITNSNSNLLPECKVVPLYAMKALDATSLILIQYVYVPMYLLTYLLHGAESFLSS